MVLVKALVSLLLNDRISFNTNEMLEKKMTSEDFALLLVFLSIVQFYFTRKFYLQTKVLRLEFSMFIRNRGVQIDELSNSATDAIVEQVKCLHPEVSAKGAVDFVPDDVREATRTYWNEVEQVQKVLLRNGIKSLSRRDSQFALSDDFR